MLTRPSQRVSRETRFIEQILGNPEDLDTDWYRRWGHVTNPAWRSTDPPGTNPQRLTMPWIAPTDSHINGMISGTRTSLDGMVFTDDGTGIRPFREGDLTSRGGIGTTNSTSGGPESAIAHRAFAGPVAAGPLHRQRRAKPHLD